MAWKGRQPEQIDYRDLLGTLVNSKIQQSNPPLFQVISILLQRLGDNKDLVVNILEDFRARIQFVSDTIINLDGIATNATFLTVNDETITLPSSVQLLAGVGISFDDSVPNRRTINATATGSGVLPMVNGEEPPQLMSNGNGDLIIIPYTL